MIYAYEVTLVAILVILFCILGFVRMIWLILNDIDIEGKPVIIYKEHPKPKPGGLTKRPIKVNSDTSIWEREQDGHARSTSEIV